MEEKRNKTYNTHKIINSQKADPNPTLSVISLNLSGLNTAIKGKGCRMDIKQDLTICCL